LVAELLETSIELSAVGSKAEAALQISERNERLLTQDTWEPQNLALESHRVWMEQKIRQDDQENRVAEFK